MAENSGDRKVCQLAAEHADFLSVQKLAFASELDDLIGLLREPSLKVGRFIFPDLNLGLRQLLELSWRQRTGEIVSVSFHIDGD